MRHALLSHAYTMTMFDTRGTQILGSGPDIYVSSAWNFPRAIFPLPIFSENLWAPAQYHICRKCGSIYTYTRYINYYIFFDELRKQQEIFEGDFHSSLKFLRVCSNLDCSVILPSFLFFPVLPRVPRMSYQLLVTETSRHTGENKCK